METEKKIEWFKLEYEHASTQATTWLILSVTCVIAMMSINDRNAIIGFGILGTGFLISAVFYQNRRDKWLLRLRGYLTK